MKLVLFVVGCTVLLIGCGGGSGGSSGVDDANPIPVTSVTLRGALVAPTIEGVYYETPSLSGLTDSSGNFNYKEGEEVRFYLGSTQIGAAKQASSEVAFIELFPSLNAYESFHDLKVLYSLSPVSEQRMEFNRFHNSLAVLEAFDVDSNLSNGVIIDEGAEALLDGPTFDLSMDPKSFINNTLFLYFRNVAQADGLIDSASISALGMPLDTYYATFDSKKEFMLPIEESSDWNFDGISDSRVVYEYDQYGNTLSRLHGDGSAAPLSGNISTYNRLGQILTNTYYRDGDGIADSYRDFEYDLGGNLIRARVDDGADGFFDYGDIYKFEFLDESFDYTGLYDSDGDGVADRTNAQLRYQLDSGGAYFESVFSGGHKYYEQAFYDNGKPSSTTRYFYNSDEIESISEFNAQGQLVLREDYRWQSNVRYVSKWEYFYSADGLLLEFFYKDFDTYSSRFRYQYNEQGLLTATTVEYFETGAIGNKRDYEFSDDGLLINEYWYESTRNNEVVDEPTSTISYKYNDRGQVIEKLKVDHTFDAPDDPDGGKELWLYGYDTEGNQIHRRQDNGADGSVDSELSYKLEGAGWHAALGWIYSTSDFARLHYEETLIPN